MRRLKSSIGGSGGGTNSVAWPWLMVSHGCSFFAATWRHNSSSSSSASSSSSEYFGRMGAMEGPCVEEAQEYASRLHDAMLPLAERLAMKADALDGELQRIRYDLFQRPQHLFAKSPSSWFPAQFSQEVADGGVPPCGTSAVLLSPVFRLLRLQRSPLSDVSSKGADHGGGRSTALVEQGKDVRERSAKKFIDMHRLNYYSTITLVPRRNMWLTSHALVWNAWVGLQNACLSVIFSAIRGLHRAGKDGAQQQQNPVVGLCMGLAHGAVSAAAFLVLGLVVSPLALIPNGVLNSFLGFTSFLRGWLFFDATSGRYFVCDTRHGKLALEAIITEAALIHTVGILEFQRKKLEPDGKFKEQMQKIGFRLRKKRLKARGGSAQEDEDEESLRSDPYEVLQVKRSSTSAQIKQQYKKLAKVFHPDVVTAVRGGEAALSPKEKEEIQRKFESIAEAYQILSNPEKKRAFDNGGRQALKMHESQYGRFSSTKNVGEMVQIVFGGRALRETLFGSLYKSHWDLRFQHQVSVSIYGFECLQSIRVTLLALKLVEILDVHAASAESVPNVSAAAGATQSAKPSVKGDSFAQSSLPASRPKSRLTSFSSPKKVDAASTDDPLLRAGKRRDASPAGAGKSEEAGCVGAESPITPFNNFTPEFKARCTAYSKHLSEACFGRELIHDAGESYIATATRFLGVAPFYAPKLVIYRKLCGGFARLREGFMAHVKNKTEEELAKMILIEFFNLEYDNIISDAAGVLRYTAQLAVCDVSVSEEQRKRRMYALWYLGQELKRHGVPFGKGKADDEELTAYLQQAATSNKSTGPPPRF